MPKDGGFEYEYFNVVAKRKSRPIGKLQAANVGLDWYDYGFRFYDPVLGRFPSIDPIIEKYYYLTPYNYASNSPVAKIDLWGLQGEWFFECGPMLERFAINAGVYKDDGSFPSMQNAVKYSDRPEKKAQIDAYTQAGLMGLFEVGGAFLQGIKFLSKAKELRIAGKGSPSVWNLGPSIRGFIIEKFLGGNLPKYFPVIDKLDEASGVATSIKSMNLLDKTYQNGNMVFNKLKGYIDELKDFKGARFDGKDAFEGIQFSKKAIEFAINPSKASLSQWDQIARAMKYAKDQNIQFYLKFIKK